MSLTLSSLPPTHPVAELHAEHKRILAGLDRLDRWRSQVRTEGDLPIGSAREAELRALAAFLVGAEPHHQREEHALFPAMEAAGIAGPPAVMRMEHGHLRAMKHTLVDIGSGGGPTDPGRRAAQAVDVAGTLIGTLREHIGKEDMILYPMALQVLDATVWVEMAPLCARIGPCPWPVGE